MRLLAFVLSTARKGSTPSRSCVTGARLLPAFKAHSGPLQKEDDVSRIAKVLQQQPGQIFDFPGAPEQFSGAQTTSEGKVLRLIALPA